MPLPKIAAKIPELSFEDRLEYDAMLAMHLLLDRRSVSEQEIPEHGQQTMEELLMKGYVQYGRIGMLWLGKGYKLTKKGTGRICVERMGAAQFVQRANGELPLPEGVTTMAELAEANGYKNLEDAMFRNGIMYEQYDEQGFGFFMKGAEQPKQP